MSKRAKPSLAGRVLPGAVVSKGEAKPVDILTDSTQSVVTQSIPQFKTTDFIAEQCQPGMTVRVPLRLIDLNPLSPRRTYSPEVVDKIADSLPNEQFDAAHGYVEDGRVKLIDGGTRWHAARDTGTATLDIKIEAPPKTKLDLFNRARELNDNRSDTTALDYALSLRALLEQGAVGSQKELLTAVKGPNGKEPLTETTLSKFLRIANLPQVVQRQMATSEACSTAAMLYAVSALFNGDLNEDEVAARTSLALEIVEAIKNGQLNSRQAESLVKSKLEGPKTRERSTSHPLEFGNHKGAIKCFSKKGRIEFKMTGLSPKDIALYETEIEKLCNRLSAQKAADQDELPR